MWIEYLELFLLIILIYFLYKGYIKIIEDKNNIFD